MMITTRDIEQKKLIKKKECQRFSQFSCSFAKNLVIGFLLNVQSTAHKQTKVNLPYYFSPGILYSINV